MENDELLAAQAAFNLVSHMLYVEPSDEEVTAYLEPQMFSEAPFAMEDAAVTAGLSALEDWCDQARSRIGEGAATLDECASELRRDWLNLLVGVGEPKAPSWAGYYLNPSSALLGESALGVRKLYHRHGYQLDRMGQEPDDNLGIMLGFIAVLIQLELDGEGEAAEREAAEDCQVQLLQKFILPWLPLWRWSVERFARTEFYRGLGDLVFGLVRTYATRFGFAYVDGDKPHFVQR